MPPLRSGNCPRICRSSRVPQRVEAARLGRHLDLHRAERPADAAHPAEPGVAGEIVAAGQRHRRRRVSRARMATMAPGARPGGAPRCPAPRPECAAAAPASSGARVRRRSPLAVSVSTLSTWAVKRDHARPLEPRRRYPLGAQPDQGAAERRAPSANQPSARPARPPSAVKPNSDAPAATNSRPAHCRGSAKREPRGDPAAKADDEPQAAAARARARGSIRAARAMRRRRADQ